MKEIIERGATSQIVHVFIPDSASTTGGGKTGLAHDSAGLKIVVLRPGESAATKYLQSAGNIETIATIGTYQAPSTNKCRFREIDATDLPGWYEIHFADSLFNTTSNRRSLGGMISGAADVAPTPFQIQLSDPTRGVGSPAALPNAAAEAAGGLFTRGTGAGQINQSTNGQVDVNLKRLDNDAQSVADLKDFADTGYDPATGKVEGVKLVDTTTVNTDMRGTDNAALASGVTVTTNNDKTGYRLSSIGVQDVWDALTSAMSTANSIGKWIVDKLNAALTDRTLAAADYATNTDMTTLLGRLTATRAAAMDYIVNAGGTLATQADINALNQSASRRIILTTVGQYERPESGSTAFQVEARLYSADGVAVNADSTPTLTATGLASGSLAANLSASSNPSTGVYRWTYTVEDDATLEQVRFDLSAVIASDTQTMSVHTQVADFVSATFTTADRAKIEAVYDKLPSKSYLTGTGNSDGDVDMADATGNFPGSVDRVNDPVTVGTVNDKTGYELTSAYDPAKTAAQVAALTALAAKFTGITLLANWLRAAMRKSNNDATAVGEINADNGTGIGDFDPTTDSGQGIHDAGGGGGGGGFTIAELLATQLPELTVGDCPKDPTVKHALVLPYMKIRNNNRGRGSNPRSRNIVNDADEEILAAELDWDSATATLQQGKLE